MERTAQALWQDYRFLTTEMIKFLAKRDMSMFYKLMNQRERLQDMIKQAPDDGYRASSDGQKLLTEIQQDNQAIVINLQMRRNSVKRHNQVHEAYNGGPGSVSRMNWKR